MVIGVTNLRWVGIAKKILEKIDYSSVIINTSLQMPKLDTEKIERRRHTCLWNVCIDVQTEDYLEVLA